MRRSQRKTAIELREQAEALMRQEKWLDAIKLLKARSSVVEKHWRLLWNFGWCYFKLERLDEARKYLTRATRLAPESAVCKGALGHVYLKQERYQRAESILSESLRLKESHWVRIGLALAYLAQGKIADAEKAHLENIRRKPKSSRSYESYAAFLSDVGREAEAESIDQKVKALRRIH